jgi:hypothetical protein
VSRNRKVAEAGGGVCSHVWGLLRGQLLEIHCVDETERGGGHTDDRVDGVRGGTGCLKMVVWMRLEEE